MKHLLLHPPLVHFPIAFLFLEMLLLTLWLARKNEEYRRFARMVFFMAYGFMIAAMAAGYRDAGGLPPAVRTHFAFAVSAFAVNSARALYWFFGRPERKHYGAVLLAGSAVSNLLVAITAYEGGELVFGM